MRECNEALVTNVETSGRFSVAKDTSGRKNAVVYFLQHKNSTIRAELLRNPVAIRYKRVGFGHFVRLIVDTVHTTCVRINTAVYVF